jgi:STE24 endopeptidase
VPRRRRTRLLRRLRPRHATYGIAVAVAAGAWLVAAILLWRTKVPSDLDLPELEPLDFFSRGELGRAADFERFVRIELLLSELVILSVLALYAVYGRRFMRESAAGRIGTGMLLGMVGLAFVWLALLPFGLVELWWERRHDISTLGYSEWVVGTWFGLGGEFLFVCLALLVVMGLAGPFRDRWWIPGGAVFVGLAMLFAFVYPYLGVGERLRDPELAAEARELARAQDTSEIPVYVEDVRTFTTAPNAEASGLGPSRRVTLWNTLLDEFDEPEVRFVLAHEIAHHSREHIWKGVAWYALFAFPGAFLIAQAARRRGGMRSPQAVPLALFVFVLLTTIAAPFQNVVTRHLEEEADWVALETTNDPRGAREAFERLSTNLLAEPEPPTWSYVLIETHPSILERIAMVEAWQARRGR